jgi:hypothetical protein
MAADIPQLDVPDVRCDDVRAALERSLHTPRWAGEGADLDTTELMQVAAEKT